MDYFTIDGNYYTSNLSAYLDYLKDENQTATSSDLEASLEEILESNDSESVVQITDSTLKAAGKDYVNDNKDKLAAYGVSEDKIQALFGSVTPAKGETKSESKGEKTSSCCCSNSFESLRAQNAEARSKTNSMIKSSQNVQDKNNKQSEKVQGQIAQAQEKNDILKARYEALKAEVTSEQEAKQQNNQEEANQYEKNVTGKLDVVQATQTEKYQQIDEDSQKVSNQNETTEGFKADSSAHFSSVKTNINAASDAHDNSVGYTLAGVNMTETGAECANEGLAINLSAINLAESGQNMMNSADQATQVEGQQVYDRGMALVSDSFETIYGAQDVIDGSYKYYDKSNKFINKANMFMTQSSPALTSINANNAEITAKIEELQSQKV